MFNLFESKRTRSAEDQFWSWFQANESRLYSLEQDLEAVLDQVGEAMREVHPDLTFEFGPIREGGRREFVISADGIQSAFPAVEALTAVAPELERWQWVRFRPRRNSNTDISIGGRTIPRSEVHYVMAKNDDKIGLILFFDGYTEEQKAFYGNVGYLYLDDVLGEYAVEMQVGFIEFHSRESSYFAQAQPIAKLQRHFDQYWSRVAH